MKILILIFFNLISYCGFSQLVINELATQNNSYPDENGQFFPWIEIKNISSDFQQLGEWSLVSNEESLDTASNHLSLKSSWHFPNLVISPSQVLVVWLSAEDKVSGNSIHSSFSLNGNTIYLTTSDNLDVDQSISFAFKDDTFESIGRFPDGSKNIIYFPKKAASPGSPNVYPGHWQKVMDVAPYPPSDSSPNACVVLNDTIYTLSGWDLFRSSSYVWRSADGINWNNINPSAPYNPYSGFVVFREKIWAFGADSYYSSDGIDWEKVENPSPFPAESYANEGIRVCVFKDRLWAFYENKIWSSDDGFTWNLETDSTMWEPRYNPKILVFKNKLWLLGGGIGYNTGSDYYYNDVWSTEDGKNWNLETNHAEWSGRYWFNVQTYNDYIFLFGGWNYHRQSNGYQGNLNDFWVSKDGVNWSLVAFDNIWKPRHASYTFFFKNTIWLSSGYGTQGEQSFYNDIWKLVDPGSDIQHNLPAKLVYGDSNINTELVSACGGEILLESLDEDRLKIDDSRLHTVASGLATLKINQTGDSIFCKPKELFHEISIEKKILTTKVMDLTINLGEEIPPLPISYEGFVFNDNIQDIDSLPMVEVEIPRFGGPGQYRTHFSKRGYDSNYNFTYQEGDLSIIYNLKQDWVVYPNPSQNLISFHLSNKIDSQLQVFNSSGIKIIETFLIDSTIIDVSSLEKGIYYYRILPLDHKTPFEGKFIKN